MRRVAIVVAVAGLVAAAVTSGADAASDHAKVRAWSERGKPAWARTLGTPCVGVATWDRSSLFVWDGPRPVALRWSDGSTQWKRRDALLRGDPILRLGVAPVPPGPTLVGGTERSVVGLDPRTGRTSWRHDVVPGEAALVGPTRVVVVHGSTAPPSIEALDRASGRSLWASEVPTISGEALLGIAVGPRSIALVTEAPGEPWPSLELIDGETGASRFRRDLGMPVWTFGLTRGTVLLGDGQLRVLAVAVDRGEDRWRRDDARLVGVRPGEDVVDARSAVGRPIGLESRTGATTAAVRSAVPGATPVGRHLVRTECIDQG